jgi:hypothetical protein
MHQEDLDSHMPRPVTQPPSSNVTVGSTLPSRHTSVASYDQAYSTPPTSHKSTTGTTIRPASLSNQSPRPSGGRSLLIGVIITKLPPRKGQSTTQKFVPPASLRATPPISNAASSTEKGDVNYMRNDLGSQDNSSFRGAASLDGPKRDTAAIPKTEPTHVPSVASGSKPPRARRASPEEVEESSPGPSTGGGTPSAHPVRSSDALQSPSSRTPSLSAILPYGDHEADLEVPNVLDAREGPAPAPSLSDVLTSAFSKNHQQAQPHDFRSKRHQLVTITIPMKASPSTSSKQTYPQANQRRLCVLKSQSHDSSLERHRPLVITIPMMKASSSTSLTQMHPRTERRQLYARKPFLHDSHPQRHQPLDIAIPMKASSSMQVHPQPEQWQSYIRKSKVVATYGAKGKGRFLDQDELEDLLDADVAEIAYDEKLGTQVDEHVRRLNLRHLLSTKAGQGAVHSNQDAVVAREGRTHMPPRFAKHTVSRGDRFLEMLERTFGPNSHRGSGPKPKPVNFPSCMWAR